MIYRVRIGIVTQFPSPFSACGVSRIATFRVNQIMCSRLRLYSTILFWKTVSRCSPLASILSPAVCPASWWKPIQNVPNAYVVVVGMESLDRTGAKLEAEARRTGPGVGRSSSPKEGPKAYKSQGGRKKVWYFACELGHDNDGVSEDIPGLSFLFNDFSGSPQSLTISIGTNKQNMKIACWPTIVRLKHDSGFFETKPWACMHRRRRSHTLRWLDQN